MSYTTNKGIWMRCQIVELCREPQTLSQLASTLKMTRDRISKHCRRLVDEGYIEVSTETGWTNIYLTIREDKYPEPSTPFQLRIRPKVNEVIPGARVFRMEDFNHRQYELRKVEHRGIPSVMGSMD
jgi:DNA-binding transcriptional regulator GbsR (MarR family)